MISLSFNHAAIAQLQVLELKKCKKKKKEFGGKAMRVKHIYRLKPYMMMNEKCEQLYFYILQQQLFDFNSRGLEI